MADQERPYYYKAVPGSRELVTSSSAGDELLHEIEVASGEGLAPLREYCGEWLGGARFGSGICVPAAVFDALAPRETPVEQAVYLHLFRLSYGEGRNWCRAGKRDLMQRARLSDRRLNVALDGLVRKGHVKPLHRNTKGTLYRVYLPSEVLSGRSEDGLELGQKIETRRPAADEGGRAGRSGAGRRERPLESPLNEERFADVSGKAPTGPGVGEMAEWFFSAKGLKPKARDRQMTVTVLTGLLEDGFSRQEVRAAVEWYVAHHPEEATLDRLPYHIAQALEDHRRNPR
ncbi:MAG TPA: hypothetical protein VM658_05850 [bacterium]|nr:hypothetical protein [bacterium]